MTKTRPVLTLLLCTLAALLSACAPEPPGKGGVEAAETYYIDAALGFAIEYPADWTRVRVQTAPTVRWFPKIEKGRGTEILFTVTSFPPSEVPGGTERMLSDYVVSHPGFVLTAKEQIALSGTTPALQVLGYTSLRTILALFITSSQRAFVLEFSTLPEYFDQNRPFFEKMAGTFKALD